MKMNDEAGNLSANILNGIKLRASRISHVKAKKYYAPILFAFFFCVIMITRNQLENTEYVKRNPKQNLPGIVLQADDGWDKEMKLRLEKAQSLCSKFNYTEGLEYKNDFLWSKESHLAYCRNAKVATTSMLKIFLDLGGVKYAKRSIHNIAPKIYRRPSSSSFDPNDYFRFTVVRHPLVRLMSAYKDKLTKPRYYEEFRNIRRRFRQSSSNLTKWLHIGDLEAFDLATKPTFREFAMYVASEIRKNSVGFPYKKSGIINTHWKPLYMRCSPCIYHFDGILKLETLQKDLQYVERQVSSFFSIETDSGTKRNSSSLTKQRHRTLKILKTFQQTLMNQSGGNSTSDLTRMALTLISEKDKKILKKAYELDFLLFDYDPDEYG